MPDLCIVGGTGHVGLPLAITCAHRGWRVRICDLNEDALALVGRGTMPFQEPGAEPLLREALREGRLSLTSSASGIAGVPVVILTIGTPVDRHLRPDVGVIEAWANGAIPHLSDDQLIVLRSTVSPGTTEWLGRHLRAAGRQPKLAYCPERTAQRFAIRELESLPQIVSGTTPVAEDQAAELFERIASTVIRLSPLEAEFAKLFTNAYRYVSFAITNQFYMLAQEHGADFHKILHACRHDYPRAAAMPDAGLAGGPCLLKDTMQLAAFSNNRFGLGYDAMLVNEGLPDFLVDMAAKRTDLAEKTAGILGMAFKAESDDGRESLSYRLRKSLRLVAKRVLCSDPYVRDTDLVSPEQVLEEADVIFIGAPHRLYRELKFPPDKTVVDVWNCTSANEPGRAGERS